MKKIVSSVVAIGALSATVLAPMTARAFDGTITFNGNLTAQTCTINGNGTNSRNFTVTLPTVSTSSLSDVGDTGGRTPFSIALTGCTPGTGKVLTYFEPGNTDPSNGNLLVNSGGAGNLEIQLLNSDMSQIKAGFAQGTQNSETVSLVSGAATLNYFAQYFATGETSPGAASAQVNYTITYP